MKQYSVSRFNFYLKGDFWDTFFDLLVLLYLFEIYIYNKMSNTFDKSKTCFTIVKFILHSIYKLWLTKMINYIKKITVNL